MADAHQQVTVHLAVAAAAINNLPHKGQQIAIRHKNILFPTGICKYLSGRVFYKSNNGYCAEEAQIFSAALIPSRAEETIPPE